jgi:hypothetical protein
MALAATTPAYAHGADAPVASDYRTEVSGITPKSDGLTVRVIEAGARLELTNRTGRTIEVLGYDSEPYLEVRPDGVFENIHSPATYLNTTLAGDTEPPATADPSLPPQWRRVSTEPVARWHDQRTLWTSADPPPEVTADRSRTHRVRDWSVPLRDEVTPLAITGTLDWVPPPDTALWWLVSLAAAAVIGTLGLVRARVVPYLLSGLAVVVGPVAVAYAVGRQLDAGTTGVGGLLGGLFSTELWPVLTGIASVLAGLWALRRRPAADFALALAGTCAAIFAGAANASVFTSAVTPVTNSRPATATLIALGAGVALASTIRMREKVNPQRPDLMIT